MTMITTDAGDTIRIVPQDGGAVEVSVEDGDGDTAIAVLSADERKQLASALL